MSKVVSNDLFELIKSLDKSEKRYFKQVSPQHITGQKNKIVKLFDIIDAQTTYDEKQVLRKEKDISAKQLVDLKILLYKAILKSLNAYHANGSMEAVLKNMLLSVKHLFDKGLYKQCGKLIIKIKELAQQYEKQLILLEVLEWEKKLFSRLPVKRTKEDIQILFKQETDDANNNYKNICEYSYYTAVLFKEIEKGRFRSEEETKAIEKILNQPLFQKISSDLPFQSLFYAYYCMTIFSFQKNDYAQAILHAQKLVEIFESRPLIIAEETYYYIISIANTINVLHSLERYKEVPVYLEKLKKIKTKSLRLKNELFYLNCNYELPLYFIAAQFDTALKRVQEISSELNVYERKNLNTHQDIQLNYTIAAIYVVTENYGLAQRHLNKIINDVKNYRPDLQCFARLIQLIVHYESQNIEFLESAIKSTYRFLYKRNKLYKFEIIMLDFIRKQTLWINTEKEIVNAFKKLKQELMPLLEDKFEKKAFAYFDFIGWLDSKIEKKAFVQVLKEKS